MAYNKVDADGRTLIDLTSDTVTADTLLSGRTAHLASGERVAGTFEPVTGVKGNAESEYRKGDVNLTAANIGAVNKNGDAMSGTLTDTAQFIAKSTNIDRDGDKPASQTNGNEFRMTDKNNLALGGMYPLQETSGAIRTVIYSRSGSHYNILNIITDKDGTFRYSVSSPTAFRSAIGLDNLGYCGICGRTTNTSTNPWVLVAETTALNTNNTGITLLVDYTFTADGSATSTGTGILSVSARINANGDIITNRSYAKWLTKMNELNNDDIIITYNNSTRSLQIWGKSDYPYKVMRVRPLSGSDRFNLFDISKWTFTTSLNTNMYESYPTGDGITVLTPTCDVQDQLDKISGELDCLVIEATWVNNEVRIDNTSDFTSELFSKYYSYTKPKFAILELHITSNTYYYKALLNSSSVSQGNLMEALFITVANGEYIYNFTWLSSGTVGTPTVTRKALNLGS